MKPYTLSVQLLKGRCRVEKCDCWTWQQSLNRNGHPRIHHEGKQKNARRIMFEMAAGRKPKAFVFVTCGNPLCMNPEHMKDLDNCEAQRYVWQSGQGPSAAKIAATNRMRPHRAKITREQALQYRARILLGGEGLREIAAEAGLTVEAVRMIARNQTWPAGVLA